MRVLRFLAAAVLALGMVVTLASASSGQADPPGRDQCKPGWGYGDVNHQHCGPPGQQRQP